MTHPGSPLDREFQDFLDSHAIKESFPLQDLSDDNGNWNVKDARTREVINAMKDTARRYQAQYPNAKVHGEFLDKLRKTGKFTRLLKAAR